MVNVEDSMRIGSVSSQDRVEAFVETLEQHPAPTVLELGTLRSDPEFPTHHRVWVPHAAEYVMSDAELGTDVDVVADAHDLVRVFPREHFDGVVCVSVLEHLERPWVAVEQMAAVLRPGGVLYLATHQTFPLHGYPSDYFRFSTQALVVLAQDAGLVTVDVGYAFPCRIEPPPEVTRWNRAPDVQAFLNVDMCAVKPS